MAKQSFSVGQVLTANQMLSLQQTAMLGGSATAKTASYTLVAADAGTVVSVNSTSATTITVNTGLFSAGDTVTIQNWGSGLVTITAGTATVNTAGSLIVPQYDGGVLYFTSASAAIYFDFVQAGAVSPLTTKGDLYTFGSSDTRIGVGANDTVLTADSSTATGLKWATPAAGGMTLLSTTTITTGTTITVSSISQLYKHLYFEFIGIVKTSNAAALYFYPDTDSSITKSVTFRSANANTVNVKTDFISTITGLKIDNTENAFYMTIYNYASTTDRKGFNLVGYFVSDSNVKYGYSSQGGIDTASAIDSIQITWDNSENFTGGTIRVYGVN